VVFELLVSLTSLLIEVVCTMIVYLDNMSEMVAQCADLIEGVCGRFAVTTRERAARRASHIDNLILHF